MAQTKPDRNLAALIKNYYLDDAEARTAREAEWNRAYKRLLPSYIDKTKVKGPFYLRVPYCYRVLEVQSGQLMSTVEANGFWAIAKPLNADQSPGPLDIGEAATRLVDYQFRHETADVGMDNEMQMDGAARLGLGYGNAAALVEWQPSTRTTTVNAIDPYDLFLDWRHNRHFIFRRVVTLRELQDMAEAVSADRIRVETDPATGEQVEVNLGPRDGGRALKAFKKVLKATKSGERTGWLHESSFYSDHSRARQSDVGRVANDDDENDDAYVAIADDPYNARVTILEYHETKKDGIVAWVLPSFNGAEDDLLIRSERHPYGICPIVPFVPRPVDKEVYGLGIPEVVGHTDEAMSLFFRASARYVVRVTDPAVLYRKGLRLRQEYLRSQSGISIPVDDTVSDIRYMEPPSGQNLHQLATLFMRQMADMGTGESDQRRGVAGGSNTATESAIVQSNATITDRRIFWRWKRFVQQIARIMLRIMAYHFEEDDYLKILGSDAKTLLRHSPDFLEGDMEVLFGGNTGGMTAVQRQTSYRNIAQTYAQSGVVDIAALARADIREMGEADPDRFMAQHEDAPSLTPKQEHIQLFVLEQGIEVSAQDNHQTHLASHLSELQKRAGHPLLPELESHIRVHLQMLAATQQQQGAGPPQGPQPFQPEQAGQTGQPAAFTPGTADINAQRQISNNGTPGMPPGPASVPSRFAGMLQ